jgi:hypothetical protein
MFEAGRSCTGPRGLRQGGLVTTKGFDGFLCALSLGKA